MVNTLVLVGTLPDIRRPKAYTSFMNKLCGRSTGGRYVAIGTRPFSWLGCRACVSDTRKGPVVTAFGDITAGERPGGTASWPPLSWPPRVVAPRVVAPACRGAPGSGRLKLSAPLAGVFTARARRTAWSRPFDRVV